jgi:hypothetical protein
MQAILVIGLVLTGALLGLAGSASAQPPPLVHGCNGVNDPCWNGSLACFWFSQQMPTCLPIGLT